MAAASDSRVLMTTIRLAAVGQTNVKVGRRSARQLEHAIRTARSRREKALAYFSLALFHDNNSREREAIPNYVKAIRLGLPHVRRAEALAWLASSLYKTGSPRAAMARLNQSARIASDQKLLNFLDGLRRRIAMRSRALRAGDSSRREA
jgi:tetratricopeptide (TPR) repeat protein